MPVQATRTMQIAYFDRIPSADVYLGQEYGTYRSIGGWVRFLQLVRRSGTHCPEERGDG